MALLTYILVLGFHHIVLGYECVINTPQEGYERQLREDHFQCISNLREPNPVPVTVNVRFILKYFSLKSDKDELNLQSWMFLTWRDDRLKWDSTKYGGLEEVDIESSTIWTPSFRIYNSADSYDTEDYFFLICSVKHTGSVVCVPRTNHVLYCNVKLDDFPFDAQECRFIFGPLDYNNRFNVSFGSRAIGMIGADYGSSWFISDYKQEFHKVPHKILNVTFVFEREALSLAAVVIYPALIISSLTIACWFLDVRLNERLIFTCFSVVSHFYWLTQLGENLPKVGIDPPRILLYYRGSFVVTVFTLLITFILATMCRKESTPHNIVIFINKLVYGTFVRFLVCPQWAVADDSRFNEDWTKFANTVNSLCMIAVMFTYLGLYIMFIPQPIPFSNGWLESL